MITIRRALERIVKFFHLDSWIRFLMLCVITGIAAGLVGAAFDQGLYYLYKVLYTDILSQIKPGTLSGLALLILIPAVGLFLAGAIAARWAPETRGSGTDVVIRSFHRDQGALRTRTPLIKGLCTILTIGSGGSAGKEGPTALIGAGIGSAVAGAFGLSVRDRRILMLAGCAGGLGAVLRAPLGGALFAAEMLYREPDFEHDAIIPGVISSVTAYSVFTALLGQDPFLQFSSSDSAGYWPPVFPSAPGMMGVELLHYAMLSVCCAVVAFLFVKAFRLIRDRLFSRLPVPMQVRPALSGMALGGLAAVLMITQGVAPDQVLGEGRVFMRALIEDALSVSSRGLSDPSLALTVLGILLLSRILATGLTVGSGASGGLLFPTLLVGALAGAVYAKFWQGLAWMPDEMTLTPGARAGMLVVGMGAVCCGCTKTPIACLVLISEMTGSYGLVVPLMLCCASTYLLTRSFGMEDEQVPCIADSPAHRSDFLVNVLEDIRVADALTGRVKPELIPADLPFDKILERIKHSKATTYPIVDEEDCLVGIFSLNDIRQIMNERDVGRLVVAGDLGTTHVPTVTLETRLSAALSLFTQKNIDELPVVEEVSAATSHRRQHTRRVKRPRGIAGTRRVVAMLTRHDLISAYRKRLQDLETLDTQESTGGRIFEDERASNGGAQSALLPPDAPPDPAWKTSPLRDASSVDEDLLEEPKEGSSRDREEPSGAPPPERGSGAGA